MSDELPPGSMNLEDDAPPAEPVAPVEALPVAAAPPEPTATEQELQQAGGDPAKAGLLAALRAERQEKQALKARADKADEYEQVARANQPYVDFLRANPGLMQPKAPDPVAPPPSADPDAVEAAQMMDFYKPDGTLDVEKGAKHLALIDRRTSRQTAEAVKPYREQSLQERSTQNFARALQVKDASGQSPTPAALRSVWNTLSAEDTANPEIAATLAMLALGADRMMAKPPVVPPSNPPLYTEASGGQSSVPVRMSALEERMATQRGITPAKWAERTAGFQQGRPNVLEED